MIVLRLSMMKQWMAIVDDDSNGWQSSMGIAIVDGGCNCWQSSLGQQCLAMIDGAAMVGNRRWGQQLSMEAAMVGNGRWGSNRWQSSMVAAMVDDGSNR